MVVLNISDQTLISGPGSAPVAASTHAPVQELNHEAITAIKDVADQLSAIRAKLPGRPAKEIPFYQTYLPHTVVALTAAYLYCNPGAPVDLALKTKDLFVYAVTNPLAVKDAVVSTVGNGIGTIQNYLHAGSQIAKTSVELTKLGANAAGASIQVAQESLPAIMRTTEHASKILLDAAFVAGLPAATVRAAINAPVSHYFDFNPTPPVSSFNEISGMGASLVVNGAFAGGILKTASKFIGSIGAKPVASALCSSTAKLVTAGYVVGNVALGPVADTISGTITAFPGWNFALKSLNAVKSVGLTALGTAPAAVRAGLNRATNSILDTTVLPSVSSIGDVARLGEEVFWDGSVVASSIGIPAYYKGGVEGVRRAATYSPLANRMLVTGIVAKAALGLGPVVQQAVSSAAKKAYDLIPAGITDTVKTFGENVLFAGSVAVGSVPSGIRAVVNKISPVLPSVSNLNDAAELGNEVIKDGMLAAGTLMGAGFVKNGLNGARAVAASHLAQGAVAAYAIGKTALGLTPAVMEQIPGKIVDLGNSMYEKAAEFGNNVATTAKTFGNGAWEATSNGAKAFGNAAYDKASNAWGSVASGANKAYQAADNFFNNIGL